MSDNDHVYVQQSVIMSHMENQLLKRPRLAETTTNRRVPYKTELCLKFQRGNCSYGRRCHFAHSNGELRQPLLNNRPERVVVNGAASRVKIWDENQNPRSFDTERQCWRYMSEEGCPSGDKCHFIHRRGSVAVGILNRSGRGSDDHQVLHLKQLTWKTRLCHRWKLTGSCPYGVKCCFAHGQSELQKQGFKNATWYADKDTIIPTKAASRRGFTTDEKQVEGKQRAFKWKDVKEVNGIYADWIDDLPSVHGDTGEE